MKQSAKRILPQALGFGIVMTLLAFPMGHLRFPMEGGPQLPPIWLQLIREFMEYSLAFFLVAFLFDWLRKRRK